MGRSSTEIKVNEVVPNHPEGGVNICTRFHGNPSDRSRSKQYTLTSRWPLRDSTRASNDDMDI